MARRASTSSSPARGPKKAAKNPWRQKLAQAALLAGAAGVLGATLLAAYAFLIVEPNLPALDTLVDYRPKLPLRVYTADNVLIGEFGDERRDFVPIAQIPAVMKNALIAIEDNDFYQHGGVDYAGIARAALANLRNSKSQGASTITMQVARNFLLTRQKTYSRKLQEILLARKIEHALSKDQILELYMNQIYLGQRAYGFGTAARVYFGKPIQNLSIAEAAMLAGLPKAPASANPVVNPARARERQQYVLKRMRDLGYITLAQYERAQKEKLKLQSEEVRFGTHAEHAAELARQFMVAQYKDEAYTNGISVYTTLTKADQDAAYAALRRGVMEYERRHGYRGPEGFIELPADADERQQAIGDALLRYPDSGALRSAVVISASAKAVRAVLLSGEAIDIGAEGLRFAAPALGPKAKARYRIRPGAVVRVMQDGRGRWAITQVPEVAAGFIALNAQTGSIRALVGGFDFALNQFDHVSQAWRQPGSTIKPFIYSAALEKGFSPGTVIDDAPLAEPVVGGNGQLWNPGNDDGRYEGPMTMRSALKKSRNLVSIRILQSITPPYAQQFLEKFGFEPDRHPANLTMALGTGAVTPLQMAGAYAVFANGGYRVPPYLIQKVVDARGKVLFESNPVAAGSGDGPVLDPRNVYLVDSMLHDVVRSGTGAAAGQRLQRPDLAGKTGTTNEAMDGWFAGYGGGVVAVAWMGYDKPRSLGSREFGGTVALPIWTDYMRAALRGQPQMQLPMPAGLAQVNGDWMYQEYVTRAAPPLVPSATPAPDAPSGGIRGFFERLFGPQRPPTEEEKEKQRQKEMYFG